MSHDSDRGRARGPREEIAKILASGFVLAIYIFYILPAFKWTFYGTLITTLGLLVIGYSLGKFLVRGTLNYLIPAVLAIIVVLFTLLFLNP